MPLSAKGFGRNPKVARIIHYGIYIYVFSILGALGLDIARVNRESVVGELYTIPILIGCATVLGHYYILCERCMANMPLNGAEKAAKRKVFLRLSHSGKLLLVIAALFIFANVFDWLIRLGIPDKPTRRLVEDLAVYVPLMLMMVCFHIHSGLQPWCPWCRDDGGGEGSEVPEPQEDHGKPVPR